jgi:hypothetical protein
VLFGAPRAPRAEGKEKRVDQVHCGLCSKPMDQACLFTMSQAHRPATHSKPRRATSQSHSLTRVRAGPAQTDQPGPYSALAQPTDLSVTHLSVTHSALANRMLPRGTTWIIPFFFFSRKSFNL